MLFQDGETHGGVISESLTATLSAISRTTSSISLDDSHYAQVQTKMTISKLDRSKEYGNMPLYSSICVTSAL